MSIQTNLTTDQVKANLDQLRLAMLSGTLEVQFSDGKRQRFQSTGDILKAIAAGEEMLRDIAGQTESRVSYAQHKRGDGPGGPCRRW